MKKVVAILALCLSLPAFGKANVTDSEDLYLEISGKVQDIDAFGDAARCLEAGLDLAGIYVGGCSVFIREDDIDEREILVQACKKIQEKRRQELKDRLKELQGEKK